MITSLHEALERRAKDIDSAHMNVDELVGLGEQKLRRRRVTAALGSAAAVVVVVALAFGAAKLNGSTDQGPGPTDGQKTGDHKEPDGSQARPIVYTDDLTSKSSISRGSLFHVGTLHVGDREVEIDQTILTVQGWSMHVTDTGAVYAQDDHTVWLTDGGPPRQIGTNTCAGTGALDFGGLVTGDAGPLVAWFDCSPGSRGDLVVYDTSLGHEVARHPLPSCRAMEPQSGSYESCVPDAVIGGHVYFTYFSRSVDQQFRLDVTSGQVTPAGAEMDAELRTHARLVSRDSRRAGTPADVFFQMVGSRLVPMTFDHASDVDVPNPVFDTATGQPVRFRLPSGYQPAPPAAFDAPPAANDIPQSIDRFSVFEWLDDDTVALAQGPVNSRVGDIITCHLSDGSCSLAVEATAPDGKWRIVPGGGIPG